MATMAVGRVFIGRQAIHAGAVDAIATQEKVIAEFAAGRIGRASCLRSGRNAVPCVSCICTSRPSARSG